MDGEKFNFVIGRPWGKEAAHNPGAISDYTIMNRAVHYGPMEEAEGMRQAIEEREKKPYFIYRLVLVEESN